jgi:hypothetical protein
MVVALNKTDLLPEAVRPKAVKKATKLIRETLAATKFAGAAVIPVSAKLSEHLQELAARHMGLRLSAVVTFNQCQANTHATLFWPLAHTLYCVCFTCLHTTHTFLTLCCLCELLQLQQVFKSCRTG